MDHSSMDHGSMDSSSSSNMPMSMSTMSMTFFTSHTTPLFSEQWTPSTVGQYAGTCIFLIVLSVILRLLYGIKCGMEARWRARDLKRRYIVTQPARRHSDDSEDEDVEIVETGVKGSEAVLTTNGVTEKVKVVHGRGTEGMQPFRLSVDLTRAVMVTVMVGVGYLLMLAVMTMNVGYFMSVLAGAFVGELAFGRYSTHQVEEHH